MGTGIGRRATPAGQPPPTPLLLSPQLHDYLTSVTPAHAAPRDALLGFARAAAAAGLTRSEAAAVANHGPATEVAAYALVPDLDARPCGGAGPVLRAAADLLAASDAALAAAHA